MDRHCSRQSPYQPSADQIYLDYLHLERRDDGIDERFRALDLSSRPLSAFELEEHHKRTACLKEDANDRWAQIERMHTVEKRAFTALHQCKFPPAKTNNGMENTYRQPSGGILRHSQPKPRPRPLDLANEDSGQRQSLGTRRSERGYLGFEIADQKRRVARMGLGGRQSHGESATPQKTLPLLIPEPTDHLFSRTCAPKVRPVQKMQGTSKVQELQKETLACGQLAQEHTNNVLLDVQASQEAGQRKLAQQKRELQKVQLPTAKPGNLYPGPTRIPGILRPIRIAHDDDDKDRSIMSELALSVHLKSKMASQEAYRKYKEVKERKNREDDHEHRKAASSVPRSENTRTESIEHLLAPASLRRGKLFWDKYDMSYPLPRQSDGIHRSPSLDFHDSASVQPLITSPDHPIGADELAHHARISPREAPLDLSRMDDLHAAIEAIDKTSSILLESPETASGHEGSPLLEPSIVSILRNREEWATKAAGLSPVTYEDPPVKVPRQDVSLSPIPQAEHDDTSAEMREDEAKVEDAVEVALLEDIDIRLEWEEVDDSLGDDGWSDVEQDLVDNKWTVSPCSSDVEWASDIASEAAFDY
ncbi:MAG: hypothetical protein Q9161_007286 [Pseudevernia consocians]